MSIKHLYQRPRLLFLTVGLFGVASIIIVVAATSPGSSVSESQETGSEKVGQERLLNAINNIVEPFDGAPCEVMSDMTFITEYGGMFDTLAYTMQLVTDGPRVYYDSEPARYYQNSRVGVMISNVLDRVVLFDPRSNAKAAFESERLEKKLAFLFEKEGQLATQTHHEDNGVVLLMHPISEAARHLIGDSLRAWIDQSGRLQRMDVSYPAPAKLRYINVIYRSIKRLETDDHRLSVDPLDRVMEPNGQLLPEFAEYRFIDNRRGTSATGTMPEGQSDLEEIQE